MIPLSEANPGLDLLFDEFYLIQKEPPPLLPKVKIIVEKWLTEAVQDDYPAGVDNQNSDAIAEPPSPRFNGYPLIKSPKSFEDEITQCIYLFLKDYWEPVQPLETNNTTPHVLAKQLFLLSMRMALPAIVKQNFFKTPHNITIDQKKMVLNMLGAVNNFVFDLTNSYDSMRLKGFEPSKCGINLEETKHLEYFHELFKKRGKKLLIPENLDPQELRKNEHELVQKLILQSFALYPDLFSADAKEILQELIEPILNLIDQLLSPYALALMISRILSDDLELVIPKDPKIRLRDYDASDVKFSREVGDLIYQISEKAAGLGVPGGLCGQAIKLFLKFLQGKKDEIGMKTQQSINRMTNSPCMIMPFRLLRSIMWKETKEGIKLTFVGCFDLSQEHKLQLQKNVEALVQDRLLNRIQLEVNAHIPKPAKIFVNHVGKLASSVKDYCNNLSSKSFRLSQQPRLLRILIYHYVLEALVASKL